MSNLDSSGLVMPYWASSHDIPPYLDSSRGAVVAQDTFSEARDRLSATVSQDAAEIDKRHAAADQTLIFWDNLYAMQIIDVGSKFGNIARSVVQTLVCYSPVTKSIRVLEENEQWTLWIRIHPWSRAARYGVYELRRLVDPDYVIDLHLIENEEEAPEEPLVLYTRYAQ